MADEHRGGAAGETCWWPLDLVRYAVVTLVVAVAVAVAVKTLVVVLRPKHIKVVLLNGSIWVERYQELPPAGNLSLSFYLFFYNPTNYDCNYSDVSVSIIDVASSQASIFDFSMAPLVHIEPLQKLIWSDQEPAVPYQQVSEGYVSLFYDEGTVDVVMRLKGQETYWHPKQPDRVDRRNATFDCWPVTVGFDASSTSDVSCLEVHIP